MRLNDIKFLPGVNAVGKVYADATGSAAVGQLMAAGAAAGTGPEPEPELAIESVRLRYDGENASAWVCEVTFNQDLEERPGMLDCAYRLHVLLDFPRFIELDYNGGGADVSGRTITLSSGYAYYVKYGNTMTCPSELRPGEEWVFQATDRGTETEVFSSMDFSVSVDDIELTGVAVSSDNPGTGAVTLDFSTPFAYSESLVFDMMDETTGSNANGTVQVPTDSTTTQIDGADVYVCPWAQEACTSERQGFSVQCHTGGAPGEESWSASGDICVTLPSSPVSNVEINRINDTGNINQDYEVFIYLSNPGMMDFQASELTIGENIFMFLDKDMMDQAKYTIMDGQIDPEWLADNANGDCDIQTGYCTQVSQYSYYDMTF